MNLLITGGAGFIGSSLVRWVLKQPAVKKLVNLDCLTYAGHLENLAGLETGDSYHFEKVDLRDHDSVRRVVSDHDITHVMHLAAESHVDRSIARPEDFMQTNVMGTFHLLEACLHHWKGKGSGFRFLHVSTDEVYGSLGPEGLFTETSPYAPNSPYSASKASSDMMVRAYHHTYGLPTVIVNSANNYGPRQFPEKLIPVVIESLLQRRSIPIYGDGLNVRDWLFVEDHVRALWTVLISGVNGESYNVSAENELTNLDLVQRLCDLVDEMKPELGGQSRSLMAFVEDRPGHDRRYALDAGKIRRNLGWQPSYSFDTGLRETVSWYLQHQDWVEVVTKKNQKHE